MAVRSYWYTQFFKQVFADSPAYAGWKSTGGDSFRIMLVTSAYAPNQDTHDVRNDVLGEVSGPGYTAGGHLLTGKTISIASGSLVLAAAPVQWSGATFTARRAVIYDDTNSSPLSKQLVRWVDFGQEIELNNQTLTITFDDGGEIIIDISQSTDLVPPELTTDPIVDGDRLSMVYDESLNPTAPATSAFSVTADGGAVAVSTSVISGSTVQIGLASSVTAGQAVLLTYTVPGSNPIRDLVGNLTSELISILCSNITQAPPVDSDVPVLQSLAVDGAGLVLVYDESLLNTSVPAVGAFAITVNGVARSATAVFINGSQVFITLASAVIFGQTVLASYTAGGSPIKDLAGNDAANFTAQAATNNTPAETVPPAVVSLSINTSTLTITYDETLASNTPPPSAFSCLVNGNTRTVANAVISGSTVVLTLGSPVISTDTVTLSYAVPTANPVEDLVGNNASPYSSLQVQNLTAPAPALVDNASFVSQFVPALSMVGSTSQSVSVIMRNTGTTSWNPASNYHLYSQNPDGNTTWGISQVQVASPVLPNSNHTFSFQITAPNSPATYSFQWRMRVGTTEFGDQSSNVSIVVSMPSAVKAFPTAEGFGANALGGRGGRVIFVTNLNNAGAGSFREAAEASGPRFIIFKVSGTINLTDNVRVTHPFCYIAGQTSPGGVQLKGPDKGLFISASNVIVRHMRSRPGGPPAGADSGNCIIVYSANGSNSGSNTPVTDVIVDHCSCQWGNDDMIMAYSGVTGVDRVTYQWCIVGRGTTYSSLGAFGTALVAGGWDPAMATAKYTFHHNLFAHSTRMPKPQRGGVCDYRNNVNYNWGSGVSPGYASSNCMQWGEYVNNHSTKGNIVNNIWKTGPNSQLTPGYLVLGNGGSGRDAGGTKIYVSGNYTPDFPTGTSNDWNHPWRERGPLGDSVLPYPLASEATFRSLTEYTADPVTLTPTASLLSLLTGATIGAYKPTRDSVDSALIAEVVAGTGNISTTGGGGPWPTLTGPAPPLDSNNDGIPDAWALAHGLSTTDPSVANTVAPNGYTWIENYLNELAGDGGIPPEVGEPVFYGTYENPFTEESIWNSRIASTATLTAANTTCLVSSVLHIWDQYVVKQVTTTDPSVNVHNKTSSTYCTSNVEATVFYQVPLPSSYVDNVLETNGISCFVETNNASAPGRIREGLWFQRCSAGSAAAQYASGTAALGSAQDSYTVQSTGVMSGNISVGAGRFGSLGGVIRSGEWTSAAGVPIPHALRAVMPVQWLNYNAGSSTPGYRWPAKSADGYASTAYSGSVPSLVMGSLLTVLPSVTESSLGLQTEPGKKIFHAIQDYGMYVVDTFSPTAFFPTFGLCVQCETHSSSGHTVTNEFLATYGVDLVGRFSSGNGWTGFELQFHSDMCVIFSALRVVTNTSQSTPKG